MRYVVSFRDSYSDGLLLFTATDTYAASNRIANQGVKLE